MKLFNKKYNSIIFNKKYLFYLTVFLIYFISSPQIISQSTNTLKDNNFLKLRSEKIQKPISFNNKTSDVPVSKAEFILMLSTGALLPLNDLKGDLSTVSLTNGATSSRGYYEKWGFSIGLIGKLPAGKKGNFRPKISLFYNSLNNSGSDSTGTVTIEPVINMLQVSLGLEYVIMKSDKFLPFIEADFAANILTRSITFTEGTNSFSFTANYNRNVRYGFGAGAGVEYQINKTYSLIGGIRYNYANLIGKESDNTGAHDFNDAAHTVNGFAIDQKIMTFISAYLGVSLNIRD